MAEFTKRECKREANCRWCDETIVKGQKMVTGYLWRNRGMSVYFCIDCARKVGKLADGKT